MNSKCTQIQYTLNAWIWFLRKVPSHFHHIITYRPWNGSSNKIIIILGEYKYKKKTMSIGQALTIYAESKISNNKYDRHRAHQKINMFDGVKLIEYKTANTSICYILFTKSIHRRASTFSPTTNVHIPPVLWLLLNQSLGIVTGHAELMSRAKWINVSARFLFLSRPKLNLEINRCFVTKFLIFLRLKLMRCSAIDRNIIYSFSGKFWHSFFFPVE